VRWRRVFIWRVRNITELALGRVMPAQGGARVGLFVIAACCALGTGAAASRMRRTWNRGAGPVVCSRGQDVLPIPAFRPTPSNCAMQPQCLPDGLRCLLKFSSGHAFPAPLGSIYPVSETSSLRSDTLRSTIIIVSAEGSRLRRLACQPTHPPGICSKTSAQQLEQLPRRLRALWDVPQQSRTRRKTDTSAQ